MPAPTSTYADPLVYDIIHTPGTREEVAALVRIARRFLPKSPRFTAANAVWVEPASGTGRCLRELTKRGGPCLGLDIDKGMIAFAQAAHPTAHPARAIHLAADMRRMNAPAIRRGIKQLSAGRSPKPIVAFCPHNSVRHLPSDADMLAHLRSMRDLLAPSAGIYLVGIGMSGPDGEHACETVLSATRRGVHVREIIDFLPPEPGSKGKAARSEKAYKHVTVTRRGVEREIISRYTLRTYTLAQWHTLVSKAGLIEAGVAGPWGEVFDHSRQHYAYRVLTPKPRV